MMKLHHIIGMILAVLVLAACGKESTDDAARYDTWQVEISAVDGLYSVAPGRQVQFAHGNVQYLPALGLWRTAEQQYHTVGSRNEEIGRYLGSWIDLLGWGTGNNPALHTIDTADYTDFEDWGAAFGPEWRTLTEEEWEYLLFYREGAQRLRSSALVCGSKGYLLLPDGWEPPTGLDMTPDSYEYVNVYDRKQWRQMEASGAVFLPACGYRHGTAYHKEDLCYWSATSVGMPGYEGMRVFVVFDPKERFIGLKGISSYCGLAVRLAADVATNTEQ